MTQTPEQIAALQAENDELMFWLRKARDVLATQSLAGPDTPARRALVFVNAGLFPQARAILQAQENTNAD